MAFDRIVLNADTISILVVVFVSLAAATLVPAVHRFLAWPLEVLIWAGLIAVSVLRVAGIADAHVREATTSAAWAGVQLIGTQFAVLQGGVQTWLVNNRYGLAMIAIFVLGVDVLALALIRSHRAANRAMPQIRLGEWFVMPTRTAPPVVDPLVDLDRRLAAGMRASLQSVGHSTAARAMFVKPFAHAFVHLLGPGPARLRMVKLALGFEGHEEGLQPVDLARATPALADGSTTGTGDRTDRPVTSPTLAAVRARRSRRQHRQGWWQFGSARRVDAPRKAAADQSTAALRREVKDVAAPRANRLAS